MFPYQERVVQERNELSEKIDKLRTFNNSHAFKQLMPVPQGLLIRQYLVMASYLGILNQRIALFLGED